MAEPGSGPSPAVPPAPTWKRVFAAILDALTAFVGFGLLVAAFTGGMTRGGFALEGWPAVLVFALVIAYFYVGRRHLGGTLWDRIFGIARPQPF